MATLLLGFDVESVSDGKEEDSAGFIEQASRAVGELRLPVTWYVTGQTLERFSDMFRDVARCPFIDLQSHTYAHLLLKTVVMKLPAGKTVHGSRRWHIEHGASVAEIDKDLEISQQIFLGILGRRAFALTAPWAYYRGLGDRPDLLGLIHKHAFRALRSFGRDQEDAQPVPLGWQPFFYSLQGYPDVLECMIHDYQDETYWRIFSRQGEAGAYKEHLKSVIQQMASANQVFSLCAHDHGCSNRWRFRKRFGWLEEVVQYALDRGVVFRTATEFYREARDERASFWSDNQGRKRRHGQASVDSIAGQKERT